MNLAYSTEENFNRKSKQMCMRAYANGKKVRVREIERSKDYAR